MSETTLYSSKWMAPIVGFLYSCFFIFLAFGCGSNGASSSFDVVSNEPNENVQVVDKGDGIVVEANQPPVTVSGAGVVASNTRILSDESLRNATVFDDVIYVEDLDSINSLPTLAVGDVIASGVQGGLLRRIVSLNRQKDSLLEIRTEDVGLASAFEEGEFQVHVGFGEGESAKADDPSGATRTWLSADLSDTTLYESEDEGFKLTIESGLIEASPDFDFKLSFSNDHLHLAEVLTTGNVHLKVKLKAEGEYEKEFSKSKEIPLYEKSALLWFGGLPVQVTPFVQISIGVEGKLTGKAEATAGVNMTIPLVHDYKFHDIDSDKFQYSSQGEVHATPDPKFSTKEEGSFEAKVFLELQFGIRIYSKLSASIDVGPYLKTEVKTDPKCTYSVVAGAGGRFTVHLDAIGEVIEEKEEDWEIVDFPKVLSSGECFGEESNVDGVACDSITITGNQVSWPDDIDKCTVINGNLTVEHNTDELDLSQLENIEAVKGMLKINGNQQLSDLSWLKSLKVVEGDVGITSNGLLLDLDPLNSLEEIKGVLYIRTNPDLETLPVFGALKTLGGAVINDNLALTTVSGFNGVTTELSVFEFENNGKDGHLTTASGFNAVPNVTGDIRIVQACDSMSLLQSASSCTRAYVVTTSPSVDVLGRLHHIDQSLVASFARLEKAGSTFDSLLTIGVMELDCLDCKDFPDFPSLLSISQSEEVSDQWMYRLRVDLVSYELEPACPMPSFMALEYVGGRIEINGHAVGNKDVQLMANLVEVHGSVLVNVGSIATTVDAFDALAYVAGSLTIVGTNLATIKGMGALETVEELGLGGALVSVPNFNALTSYGNKLVPEDSLAHWGEAPNFGPLLESYPTMSSLKKLGRVEFRVNTAMVDFGGLTGLEQVQEVDFRNNDALATLSGLSSLKEIGGLYPDDGHTHHGNLEIQYNSPGLQDISGLGALETVEKNVVINNNGPINATAMSSLSSVGNSIGVSSTTENYCATEAWLEGVSSTSGGIFGYEPEEGCP